MKLPPQITIQSIIGNASDSAVELVAELVVGADDVTLGVAVTLVLCTCSLATAASGDEARPVLNVLWKLELPLSVAAWEMLDESAATWLWSGARA